MSDLATIFSRLGVSSYADRFVEHGFENWEALECMTEKDFDFLGVKLGHRRIIQKEIARRQGLNSRAGSQPQVDGEGSGKSNELGGDGVSQDRMKRRYRRHPKPDENAPRRPYSAYAMFCNKVREDLQEQDLCFVELAKIAGRRWQALSLSDKEPWIRKGLDAKKTYDEELARYRQTEEYEKYSEYLTEFRSKHPKPEPTETKRSYQHQTSAERGGEANSLLSRESTDSAVEGLQQKRSLDEMDEEDSFFHNAQELIGQELHRRTFSSLDHSDSLERADFNILRADNFCNVRMINPFDHVSLPEV